MTRPPAATRPICTHDAARRRALLAWYRREHRRLPWRAMPGRLGDPYRVLVSEAMLQQTQVATVIDYFNRFITALPTLADLAAADEQAVLRLWQGLGYYRRARHLHAAAKAIMSEHGGAAPADVDALRSLPGVGRYTAGAMASIAFGVSAPLVDGNVARVLARWEAIDEPVDRPAVQKRLWALASSLLPPRPGHPGDWNQALMELGAMICTPRGPRCLACPVRQWCRAAERGLQDQLPRRSPRRKPLAVTHHLVAVARDGTFLFEQRDDTGLWANLWQMPTWEAGPTDGSTHDIAAWLIDHVGLDIARPKPVARFDHATTHRAITFRVWHAHVRGGRRPRAMRWRRLDQLDDLPLARPQQYAVKLLKTPPSANTPSASSRAGRAS